MNFAPVVINLQTLKVNSIDHSAILNMGPSQHIDFYLAYKRNQGIGEQNGDQSPILSPISLVLDHDINDTPSVKNSII
ncbi:hypothetical protein ACQKP0_11220 [Heyndrickxia sp. NPDC080065]|uniref:hypothetical protein n=1 Tax=Heyndrickxia sp. NPDC080065 TaxID=3390568 RepID=UPI003CFDC546